MASIGNMIVNLIANTGKFESNMKRAQGTLSNFDKTFRSMKELIGAGVVGIAVRGFVDGITNASKAIREGDDAIYAFSKSIPIIGGLTESFHSLYVEVSGLAEQLEAVESLMSANSKIESLQSSIMADVAKMEGKGGQNEAEQKYLDTLKKIDEIESQMREAKRKDSSLTIANMETYKRKAKEIYDFELKMLENKEAEKKAKEMEKQTKELENRADYYADSILTPMERQIKMQEEINMLRDKGLLTEEQARRASEMFSDKLGKRTSDATAMEIERGISVKALAIGGSGDKQDRTNTLLAVISSDIKTLNQRMVMN
jgi:hypothetical protein